MSTEDKGDNHKSDSEDKEAPASNGVSGDSKKSGTRVFKKSSPNGKVINLNDNICAAIINPCDKLLAICREMLCLNEGKDQLESIIKQGPMKTSK